MSVSDTTHPPAGGGPEVVLETRGLRKVFKDVVAVQALDLSLRRGEVYGFLGPNGAGKTTTIKMVLGLTFPTSGTARLQGIDVFADPVAARTGLGYLPESVAFYENLTARQTLAFFAEAKGAPKDSVPFALERVGLTEAIDKRVGRFSRGMRQLLGIAQAFLGEPRLLILDEPTIGLDPIKTRLVREMIREVNSNGTTVFFSSHILSEVEEVCDRVGVLSAGALVGEDSPGNLSALLDVRPALIVSLFEPSASARRIAESVPGVLAVRETDGVLRVECPKDVRGEVLAAIAREGIRVKDIHSEEPSLEEVFVRLTARRGDGT